MSRAPRFLVCDAYTADGREILQAGGASIAGHRYAALLTRLAPPGATADVFFVADPGAELPAPLASYDGVVWTGSSLTAYHDVPEVRCQIELARRVLDVGVPAFGSCWAAQIAAIAGGGRVDANPLGREAGVARKIRLSPEGASHPLYRGKAGVFDAFTMHNDVVVAVDPSTTRVLASNPYADVQAVAVEVRRGRFWAVQYHPEWDLGELARIFVCRTPQLLAGGFFPDEAALLAYVDDLEALAADPGSKALRWRLGVDDDVLDEALRAREVVNWMSALVLPRAGGSAAAR